MVLSLFWFSRVNSETKFQMLILKLGVIQDALVGERECETVKENSQ